MLMGQSPSLGLVRGISQPRDGCFPSCSMQWARHLLSPLRKAATSPPIPQSSYFKKLCDLPRHVIFAAPKHRLTVSFPFQDFPDHYYGGSRGYKKKGVEIKKLK